MWDWGREQPFVGERKTGPRADARRLQLFDRLIKDAESEEDVVRRRLRSFGIRESVLVLLLPTDEVDELAALPWLLALTDTFPAGTCTQPACGELDRAFALSSRFRKKGRLKERNCRKVFIRGSGWRHPELPIQSLTPRGDLGRVSSPRAMA